MVDLTSPDPTVSALPPTALVEAEFGISTSAYAANKDGEQVLRLNTEAGDISITKRPYSPRSAAQETRFSRIEARHVGVDRPNLFGVGDMMQPHYQAPGSIAAADMDNDADVDVVLADIHGGIRIFLNDWNRQISATRIWRHRLLTNFRCFWPRPQTSIMTDASI